MGWGHVIDFENSKFLDLTLFDTDMAAAFFKSNATFELYIFLRNKTYLTHTVIFEVESKLWSPPN